MLSLKKCKEISPDIKISDSEWEELRQALYSIAQIAVPQYPNHIHLDEEFDERAAIMEYDAGVARFEAEMMAFGFQKNRLQ